MTSAASKFLEDVGMNMDEEKEEKKKEVAPRKSVIEIVAGMKDAPAAETLEAWKAKYGKVFAYAADEPYIFRILTRNEHRQIGRALVALANSSAAEADPDLVDETLYEKTVMTCLLHPRVTPEFLSMSPAGLLRTIYNLIMEASHFVDPETAKDNTARL